MVESIGKDFNFYQRVVAVGGSFPLPAGTAPHVQIAFRGARRIMLVCTAGSDVQYSFNGNVLHGRISANQIFNFDVRNEDKMWFLGSGTVDVHAWHIGV
jgi:hypothetical protein